MKEKSKKMKEDDMKDEMRKGGIAIAISALALLTSIVSAIGAIAMLVYEHGPSKVNLLIADKITFSLDSVLESTETPQFRVIIPLVITNSGGREEVLTSLSLVLENMDASSDSYIMEYRRIVEMDDAGRGTWIPVDSDNPFFVEARSTRIQHVLFEGDEILPVGSYRMHVLGWNSESLENLKDVNYQYSVEREFYFTKTNHDFLIENGIATMYPGNNELKSSKAISNEELKKILK